MALVEGLAVNLKRVWLKAMEGSWKQSWIHLRQTIRHPPKLDGSWLTAVDLGLGLVSSVRVLVRCLFGRLAVTPQSECFCGDF